MFNWTLGPPELPYDLLEALDFLKLSVFEEPASIITIREIYSNVRVGRMEERFRPNSAALITLERDVSGSLHISGVEPKFDRENTPFQLRLEVRLLPT